MTEVAPVWFTDAMQVMNANMQVMNANMQVMILH
jgi:hypothetical protein